MLSIEALLGVERPLRACARPWWDDRGARRAENWSWLQGPRQVRVPRGRPDTCAAHNRRSAPAAAAAAYGYGRPAPSGYFGEPAGHAPLGGPAREPCAADRG